MLKRKQELNYRKGLTWKDCSTCLEFVDDINLIGISDEKLQDQPRCRIIGMKPGRQYRILSHFICDRHNPNPKYHRGEQTMKNLVSTLTWRPIGKQHNDLPDADLEILVFDGFLNDTVKAYRGMAVNGQPVWIEQITDQQLKDPQFWTDVPFPGEEK